MSVVAWNRQLPYGYHCIHISVAHPPLTKLKLVVTAAVVVGWGGGEAVVTIIVVVDDVLDIADVVETELDSLIFLRRFLASSRLSGEAGLGINSVNLKQPKGLIMYPSSSFSIFKFNSK